MRTDVNECGCMWINVEAFELVWMHVDECELVWMHAVEGGLM